MRNFFLLIIPAIFLGGCDRQEDHQNVSPAKAAGTQQMGSPSTKAVNPKDSHWTFNESKNRSTLVLQTPTNAPILSLSCPSGEKLLQVNVPGFTPIGSEERLSLGSAGEVVALVADFRGDRRLGGVSATAAVPLNLAALISGPVFASYGSQTSGPHPAVPLGIAKIFVAACYKAAPARTPRAEQPESATSPCYVQEGHKLPEQALRAIGTEPFWAARIEGRCVTYSHPEDQQGTRVWTRFKPIPHGGAWTGALDGQQFELRTRNAPQCSDGMSDKSYPLAVELLVKGERRKGCAEPY